jgi:hypothetical protein
MNTDKIDSPTVLVFRGNAFPVVDNQHLHPALRGFQFQPELILDRRENRWPGRVAGLDVIGRHSRLVRAIASAIRRFLMNKTDGPANSWIYSVIRRAVLKKHPRKQVGGVLPYRPLIEPESALVRPIFAVAECPDAV